MKKKSIRAEEKKTARKNERFNEKIPKKTAYLRQSQGRGKAQARNCDRQEASLERCGAVRGERVECGQGPIQIAKLMTCARGVLYTFFVSFFTLFYFIFVAICESKTKLASPAAERESRNGRSRSLPLGLGQQTKLKLKGSLNYAKGQGRERERNTAIISQRVH